MSPVQLLLTYTAEAAIPLFVPALWAVQRPAIGRLGLAGAVGYAYSYVYFCGTVLYRSCSAAGTGTSWSRRSGHG